MIPAIHPAPEDAAAEVILSISIHKRTDKTACPFFVGIKALIGKLIPQPIALL